MKRLHLLSIIILLALALAPVASVEAKCKQVCADTNGDGKPDTCSQICTY